MSKHPPKKHDPVLAHVSKPKIIAYSIAAILHNPLPGFLVTLKHPKLNRFDYQEIEIK